MDGCPPLWVVCGQCWLGRCVALGLPASPGGEGTWTGLQLVPAQTPPKLPHPSTLTPEPRPLPSTNSTSSSVPSALLVLSSPHPPWVLGWALH